VTMTDWAREGAIPPPAALAAAFRAQVELHFGWRLRDSGIAAHELRAVDEVRTESDDEQWSGRRGRALAGGIRLNAGSVLTTLGQGDAWRDTLIVDGHVVRTSVHGSTHA